MKALATIVEAADRVAAKWQALRENNYDAPWDDFSFYKGNARWANGTAGEIRQLAESAFASEEQALDAIERLVRDRSWDTDYDEPTAARGEILEAIAAARR